MTILPKALVGKNLGVLTKVLRNCLLTELLGNTTEVFDKNFASLLCLGMPHQKLW